MKFKKKSTLRVFLFVLSLCFAVGTTPILFPVSASASDSAIVYDFSKPDGIMKVSEITDFAVSEAYGSAPWKFNFAGDIPGQSYNNENALSWGWDFTSDGFMMYRVGRRNAVLRVDTAGTYGTILNVRPYGSSPTALDFVTVSITPCDVNGVATGEPFVTRRYFSMDNATKTPYPEINLGNHTYAEGYYLLNFDCTTSINTVVKSLVLDEPAGQKYDFLATCDGVGDTGSNLSSFTDFSASVAAGSAPWKFGSASGSGETTLPTRYHYPQYGFLMYRVGVRSIILQVDKAGDYNAAVGVNEGPNYSVIAVSMTKCDLNGVTTGEAVLSQTYDAYNATSGYPEKPLGSVTLEQGYYLLSFTNELSKNAIINYFELKGPNALDSVALAFDKTTIAKGEAVAASVTGKMSDQSDADLSGAQKSFVSSSTAIATVDEQTGEVTGVSPGTARITVNVTLGDKTRSNTSVITVAAPNGTAMTEGKLLVNASTGITASSAINVDGLTYTSFGSSETVNVGSSVTLTAQANADGKVFAYWKNPTSGRVLSTDSQYSFKVGTNTHITAVYRPAASDNNVLVEFIDRNGKVLHSNTIAKNSVIPTPDAPYAVGYSFNGWSPVFTEGMTADSNAAFIAQYTGNGESYVIDVVGGSGDGSYAYNTAVTITADADESEFAYWVRGGEVVSYSRSYTFYAWDNAILTAVTKDAGDTLVQVPTLVMDTPKIGGGRFIVLSERTLPAGCELIETGILFSSVDQPEISTSGVIKAVAQSVEGDGQFTARRDNATGLNYARAYMIYKDSDGGYELIYSNTVTGNI